MEMQNLKASVRTGTGKGKARATRREGEIPAVLYGGEDEPLGLSLNLREFARFIQDAGGEHGVAILEVDGDGEGGPALLKDVQHHPVRGTATHADFQRIKLDEPIETVIPINLVGRAKGVVSGGILDHQLREAKVRCLPTSIPDFIDVNVADLDIGDGLHVSDVTPPEGVEIITPSHYAVAAVLASRLTRTTKTKGEGAAEGAEGESEEGEGDGE